MTEYIDKNKAIELIKELENIKDVSEAEEWVDIFITTINELPIVVIEAEPIVRCKDCKWIDLCKDPEYYEYKGANGFCSKGERKDESTMGQLNPDEPINYHIENDGTYETGKGDYE